MAGRRERLLIIETSGDVAVPGDYDNIGRAEIGVWRPSEGRWFILNPVTNTTNIVLWGDPTDLPIKVFQPLL